MNLELYKVFISVANNKNITRASEELNISQPAISKSIKNLEDYLGGKLFTRTRRGVILTKEGEELYKYIKQGLDYIKSAENKFTELINLEEGTIRIGVSPTLTKEFLLPYLEIFHKKYPNINIEIDTKLWKTLIQKLRNGLLDILIIHLNDEKYDEDLNIIKCKKIHDCLIASKKYKDIMGSEISVKDINKYPVVMQAKESNGRIMIDSYLRKHKIKLNPKYELTSYSLVKEFVKKDFGIGFAVKEYIKKDLKEKTLYEIKLKEQIPPREIALVISNNNIPSFSTKKLIEIIKNKGKS